ncbi:MAG: acyl-CoA dehydrogenase family protein [Sulfuricaulis sp.]|nr:acyl-CoA dehydrogenase family protein [Sulfuricaulis sp.]
MDFELSPEQHAFRDEVRAFIQTRLPASIQERLRLGYPPTKQDIVTWQRILNERGWAAPSWPREFGGAELGQMERLILLDEMYRASAPLPQLMNVVLLGPVLMKFGTPAQRDYFLPKLVNLDLWFCQGFSEPGAGSDLAALRTAAKREGNHYVVNGQKIWTSNAHQSDWVFALVRTSTEARKQEGISFLLIDLKTPGITIRPIRSIDHDHILNEVFFDDVRVPVENLVGEENKGWSCAKFLLGNERTGIANVGLCRERLGYARELATRYTQGGKPLIEDPKLRGELAVLDAELRALELTNWRFLLTDSAQQALPAFASVLKIKGTELQQDIAALLARLAGPQGLELRSGDDRTHGPLTARYFHSRAASIYGGTTEVQKDILAKAIVG